MDPDTEPKHSNDEVDDDDVALPADTLAILNEFLRAKYENDQLEQQSDGDNNKNIMFEEDWVRVVSSGEWQVEQSQLNSL